MRIAIFTETFLPMTDGIVTRLTATLDNLLEMGHEVMVFAPEKCISDYKGIPIKGFTGIPLMIYPEKQVSIPSISAYDVLKEFGPDVIHAVNPVNIGAYGVFAAVHLNVPLVSSYHTNVASYLSYYRLGFLEPVAWGLVKWLHNLSQLNLCTSDKMKTELIRHGIKNVHVWPKGVDGSKFGKRYYSSDMRMRLTGGHPEKTVLLYVGRLGYEKNLHVLRSLLDDIPEVCLAMVGDGPARPSLEKVFAGTDAVFTGFLYGRELSEAYASSDIFVFPSTTETLGLVLIEAMASGLPCVAADRGPTAEVVQDGVTGLHFGTEYGKSMTDTVYRLAHDRELRERLSENAVLFSSRYDWRRPTEKLVEYYDRAISMSGQRSA